MERRDLPAAQGKLRKDKEEVQQALQADFRGETVTRTPSSVLTATGTSLPAVTPLADAVAGAEMDGMLVTIDVFAQQGNKAIGGGHYAIKASHRAAEIIRDGLGRFLTPAARFAVGEKRSSGRRWSCHRLAPAGWEGVAVDSVGNGTRKPHPVRSSRGRRPRDINWATPVVRERVTVHAP